MSNEDIKAFCGLLLTVGAEATDKACRPIRGSSRPPGGPGADRPGLPEDAAPQPPVHMIMRQAAVEVVLSGGAAPAGATVACLIGAADRDPGRYKDPDRFDVFRDRLTATTAFSAAADHLAFALGRHFCGGALPVGVEVEIATNQVLDAMPDLRSASGYDPAEQGVFSRGPRALVVDFTPRTA
ncbi:cytochrome P450 [Streptomyces sp. NPDC004667]|uniref:cytochrome P450 n=1 Tax=Streptomyces sp. NPDC004667 TaxID=3154285 RepID=UPI0033A6E5EB